MSISWGRAIALLLLLAWAPVALRAHADTPSPDLASPATKPPSERAQEKEAVAPSPVLESPPGRTKPRTRKRPPFQPSEKIPADVPSALPTDI